jgi:hypothetical protein
MPREIRPVRIGDIEVNERLEGWELVGSGDGRWLGRVMAEKENDWIVLQPFLELASISRNPVTAMIPGKGQVEGMVAVFDAAFVMDKFSLHPISLKATSRQASPGMSEDLRLRLLACIKTAVERARPGTVPIIGGPH